MPLARALAKGASRIALVAALLASTACALGRGGGSGLETSETGSGGERVASPRGPPRPELWVDASAPPGGDGTVARPLRALPAALGPELDVHLRSGLYRGPFQLERARVTGHGAVVLFVENPEATVVSAEDAHLEGLSLQGGAVGLATRGVVELDRVHFSGHRRAGLRAEPASMLRGRSLEFEAPADRAVAVEVKASHAHLTELRVRSAWHRGLSTWDADVVVEDATFEGAATAVHAVGGRLRAERFSSAAGTGPAVFASRCRLSLRSGRVRGHEYGLQTGPGSTVDAERLELQGTQEAAVALVATTGVLRDLEVRASGAAGAVQLLGTSSTSASTGGGAEGPPAILLERCRIRDVPALGILVRQVRAVLRDVDIEGVRQELDENLGPSLGDALHVRDAWVDVDELAVRDVEGAGVWASAGARLKLGRLTARRTGVGALVVERKARVDARAVLSEASRGPAVSVLEGGALDVRELASKGSDATPLWVDCERGGTARVLHVVTEREWPLDRCVERAAPEILDGGAVRQAPDGVAPRQRRE